MSYNVTRWQQGKVSNFSVVYDTVIDMAEWVDQDKLELSGDGCEISGRVQGDRLIVDNMCFSGEGSGHILENFLEKARHDGYYEAVVVWEGGDSIEKIIFDGGTLTKKEIDLL